jgi:hypothetical protein
VFDLPTPLTTSRPARITIAAMTWAGGDEGTHRDSSLEDISSLRLKAHVRTRYGHTAPATLSWNVATISSLFGWAVAAGQLDVSPAADLRRPRVPHDLKTKAIAFVE